MNSIDLNCDLGEGYSNDDELMKYISSANIACGYHAGDSDTMHRTVRLAIENNVAIGAHPGYYDKTNFGRVAMKLTAEESYRLVFDQLALMQSVCESHGTRIRHVKPHGALYNQAAKDRSLARSIADAVAQFDRKLVLYGLAGSFLITEAESAGLVTCSEVFADRTYHADGSLTPRSESGALITDREAAIAQVLAMVKCQNVTALSGETIPITAQTVCVHGDGETAPQLAKAIREALEQNAIDIRPPSSSI